MAEREKSSLSRHFHSPPLIFTYLRCPLLDMQAAYGETQAANEDTQAAHVETQLAYQQHYTDFKEMKQTLTAFSSFSKTLAGHKRIVIVLFAADS